MEINSEVHSHDTYYDGEKYREPRQKLFAVLRYEKKSVTDSPGWYFKVITQDQARLIKSAKDAVSFPATDGMGWVSNGEDVCIVEIIPSDVIVKKI